jgi:2-keto-4-pentenoate hydratase/2-oxohepta-3-ene-1,7-dioic acid hydratase in catechol pathway
MILLTFKTGREYRLGIKTPGGIIDVKAAAEALGVEDAPATPDAFFADALALLPALEALAQKAGAHAAPAPWLLDEDELTFAPCVPAPQKIICVGLNYRQHAAECGLPIPEHPILFSKFNNALAAHAEPVPLPRSAREYDYEAELVAVIGRRARYVSEDEALDYVLGYCNGNDISARELQRRTSQWLIGKTPDKFLPLGPYLVTAGEVSDPQNLPIRAWMNGELRQDSNTGDMVFSTAQIISYASQYMTLEPGDIVCTGTPPGVIMGTEAKRWLRPGDDVTIEVGGLCRLHNPMVAE